MHIFFPFTGFTKVATQTGRQGSRGAARHRQGQQQAPVTGQTAGQMSGQTTGQMSGQPAGQMPGHAVTGQDASPKDAALFSAGSLFFAAPTSEADALALLPTQAHGTQDEHGSTGKGAGDMRSGWQKLQHTSPLAGTGLPGAQLLRASTLVRYARRALQLVRAYARTIYPDHPDHPEEQLCLQDLAGLVPWYAGHSAAQAAGQSRRALDRRALRWFLTGLAPQYLPDLSRLAAPAGGASAQPCAPFASLPDRGTAAAHGTLAQGTPRHAADTAPGSIRGKTRSRRLRTPDDRELATLFALLGAEGTPDAALTRLWLQALLATGLRPGEMCTARLHLTADGGILSVLNEKYSARTMAGNGPVRHLCYRGPGSRARLACIAQLLRCLGRVCTTERGDFCTRRCQALYARCARLLHKVQGRGIRIINGTGYYIHGYTMRHLFAAEAKQTARVWRLGDGWVSALMGHAAPDSAWSLYADTPLAVQRGLGLPLPLSEEQARVRRRTAQRTVARPAPQRSRQKTQQARRRQKTD